MLEPITYLEHAADVLARAATLIKAGRRFALITSVEIKGGSARELGSLALVEEGGAMWGYLSNGCVDRDIQLQGTSVLESGGAKVLHYGAGSPFMDLTLPCGGTLKLLLDPTPDHAALLAAHETLRARKPATLDITPPGWPPMRFTYTPKPRLVMAGRGAVFRAAAHVANEAGFEVALLSPEAEDREVLEGLSIFPIEALTVPTSAPDLPLDAYSAFLTLFHDHDWEAALLKKALQSPARYIGAMGSKQTHALRLMSLRALGIPEDQLERIHGPIGLVPALRHAPSIGVSAIAEVIAIFPSQIALERADGMVCPH